MNKALVCKKLQLYNQRRQIMELKTLDVLVLETFSFRIAQVPRNLSSERLSGALVLVKLTTFRTP